MNKNSTIIGIAVLAVILIGGYVLYANQGSQNNGAMMEKEVTPMMQQTEETTPPQDDAMMKKENRYAGKVLAGTTTQFIEFNQADYDKALAAKKIVFLDFYANWCPVCRAEAPELHAGFDALKNENVVGFRVNYKDTETDEDEKKLAQQYGITYQHTKVVLKDGKQVEKTQDTWDKETLVQKLQSI